MILIGLLGGALLGLASGLGGTIFGGVVGALIGNLLGLSSTSRQRTQDLELRLAQLENTVMKLQRAHPVVQVHPVVTAAPRISEHDVPETAPGDAASIPSTEPAPAEEAAITPDNEPPLTPEIDRIPDPVRPPPAQPFIADLGWPGADDLPPRPPPPQSDPVRDLLARLVGGNTLAKLGVLVLLLGLAFLVQFAARQGFFPLELRLGVVALVGLTLTVLGSRLMASRRAYALSLEGGGACVDRAQATTFVAPGVGCGVATGCRRNVFGRLPV